MTTLLIGDKPSAANLDPKIAFVGTNSHTTLLKWCRQMGIERPYFANRVDANVARKVAGAVSMHVPIIALGNEAAKYLDSIGVDYFKLPHPSGRNRLLNDKFELELLLESCRDYVQTFSTENEEAQCYIG